MNLISANNSAGNVSLGNVIGATTFCDADRVAARPRRQRTLVLVNGKRMGTFSGEVQGVEGVNLSAIPFAAIERVEVLKDGASAVYGTRRDRRRHQLHHAAGLPGRRGDRSGTARPRAAAAATSTAGDGGGRLGRPGKDRYNVFFSVELPGAEGAVPEATATSRNDVHSGPRSA